MRELHDVNLAERTTLGVGGRARRLVEIGEHETLLRFLRETDEPLFVLGGGSNVVIADTGLEQTVLQIKTRGVERARCDGRVRVKAAAGVVWDALVDECITDGLSGIECLAGIPGWVGAAPIQNIGAYGQQVADVLVSVEAFDRRRRAVVELHKAACDFAYRDSVFKRNDPGRHVVLSVTFSLGRGVPAPPRHGELGRLLDTRSAAPSAATIRAAVLELRRQKSMLIDPDDPDSRSAGSFFVNPVVDAALADAIEARARSEGDRPRGARMPRYPAPEGVKLAAAWLIERAGFSRGATFGRVGLSPKHALAIINRGGATANDVRALARRIRDAVAAQLGVTLRAEPIFAGFDDPL